MRLTRDVDNVTMDLNGVELIKFHALNGADNIVIDDLTGTDATSAGIQVDLESAIGSGIGDGQVDTVTINATAGNDIITVFSSAGIVGINGASAPVAIFHAESGDRLLVMALETTPSTPPSAFRYDHAHARRRRRRRHAIRRPGQRDPARRGRK